MFERDAVKTAKDEKPKKGRGLTAGKAESGNVCEMTKRENHR
jgi:hypothetical protein